MLPNREEILRSAVFKTSRSGGKGGQNVNKVSSKVELIFDIQNNQYLDDEEKVLVKSRLENRLDRDGLLHIISQEDRSQLLNKEKTIAKLIELLRRSVEVHKKRKTTKIPKAVIQKRLKNKSVNANRKQSRRKPNLEY